MKTSVTVRKINAHVIEYDVATREPWEALPDVHTFHANRSATFHGAHTGGSASQVMGPADTVWRETDAGIKEALTRRYPGASVTFQS